MKKMFFFKCLISASFMLCTSITFPASVTFQGSGTTTSIAKGGDFLSSSGSLSGFATGYYRIILTKSGDFEVQNYYVIIGGVMYNNNNIVYLENTTYSFKVHYTVPTSVSCGMTGTFTVEFYNYLGQVAASGSGNALVVNGSISGNTDICGLNQNRSFSLALPPYSGGGSWQWNINQSGWLINGQSPPVSTSSLNVTITTPNQASTATLSITGSWLCNTVSTPICCNPTAPPTPTFINKYRLGSTCYYYLTTNTYSSATSYEWSCNSSFSSSWITTNSTTQTIGVNCPDLLESTSVPVYVRARNGCGSSSTKYQYTYFPPLSNCMMKPVVGGDTTSIISDPLEHAVSEHYKIKNLSNGAFEILFDNISNDRIVCIYSINGAFLNSIQSGGNSIKIDLSAKPKGIYFVKLTDIGISEIIKLVNN
ncbi:MAG: T9SS type A sorting domain-containing protein [Bacteroidetes bacterium]|nr:T9SS type A sorting domain-containing protein [Bacteroidota bacterium]